MATATVPQGSIEPTRLYTLHEFKRVSGLGTCALRSARNRGLRVRYVGRTGFILGADFIMHDFDIGSADHCQLNVAIRIKVIRIIVIPILYAIWTFMPEKKQFVTGALLKFNHQTRKFNIYIAYRHQNP